MLYSAPLQLYLFSCAKNTGAHLRGILTHPESVKPKPSLCVRMHAAKHGMVLTGTVIEAPPATSAAAM